LSRKGVGFNPTVFPLSPFHLPVGWLSGRFRYNRDVLDEARVIRVRDRFLRILAAVAADPERPLADLSLAESVPQVI